MNRTYALVWNPSLGAWSVADEHARRQGKGAGAVLAAALLLPAMACAADLPTGGQVVAGQGQIGAPSNHQMVINQASNKLAIDWQSFDIAAGNKVTFNQPGSDAIALNRVLGADGSKIMGQLEANGRVFLINPNGVLFGRGAQVNVGGLVASTLDISNSDFEAGRYTFKGNGSNAGVINNGQITAADGGSVALLGGTVSNNGTIIANQGSVALAAGNAMTLDFAGDGLLNVQVDEAVVDALVENHQLIRADGGQVLLTAHAGEALLKTVVNNTGVIEARTLGEKDGKIVLLGDFAGGTVQRGRHPGRQRSQRRQRRLCRHQRRPCADSGRHAGDHPGGERQDRRMADRPDRLHRQRGQGASERQWHRRRHPQRQPEQHQRHPADGRRRQRHGPGRYLRQRRADLEPGHHPDPERPQQHPHQRQHHRRARKRQTGAVLRPARRR